MCPLYSINVFSMLNPLGCILISDLVTSRYDSTLLGCTFLYQRCFCMKYHYFCKVYVVVSPELLTHILLASMVEVDQNIH